MGAGLNSTSALCSFQCSAQVPPTTGYILHHLKKFSTNVFNGFFAGGDGACVDVHQVMPAPGQVVAGGHFDERNRRQALGCTTSGRESRQIHAAGQLQGAADEIAGRI